MSEIKNTTAFAAHMRTANEHLLTALAAADPVPALQAAWEAADCAHLDAQGGPEILAATGFSTLIVQTASRLGAGLNAVVTL